MNKIKVLCIVFICLLWITPAQAFDFADFDDIFGSDSLMEVIEEDTSRSLADAMLVNEGVEIGGNYNLAFTSSATFIEGQETKHLLSTKLAGNIFLDARPNPNFRVFTNVKLDYGEAVRVSELFSDFNIEQQIFFRGGKQTINWGVGYFFSPADVINLGRIDPANPDVKPEGPMALKINMPIQMHNYYLYIVLNRPKDLDDIKLGEIGLAPKVEFVVGRSEVGLGAYYQETKARRLMATISSSIKGVNLFGEAMVSDGSDSGFIVTADKTEDNPLGLEVVKRKGLFFKGTVGARYSYTDPLGKFSSAGVAQYYYNGEGYEDTSILKNPGISDLSDKKEVSKADLIGKHHLAASLSWNRLLNSNYTLGVLWLGDLNDRSGKLTTSLTLNTHAGITPQLAVTQVYGDFSSTIVHLNVSLGSGSF